MSGDNPLESEENLIAFIREHSINHGPMIIALRQRIEDQERRLKVLEPCHKREDEPHLWDAKTGRACRSCGVTK